MNVASLELSKELYELSGWYMTHYIWRLYDEDQEPEWVQTFTNIKPEDYKHTDHTYYPAYDLGYLLRKLPDCLDWHLSPNPEVGYWMSSNNVEDNIPRVDAPTPEDAAAMLAIALFKQGILTKEVGDVS